MGLLLAAALLMAADVRAKYSGGTGEPNEPYRIADYNDLYTLADNTSDYNKCFVMVNKCEAIYLWT